MTKKKTEVKEDGSSKCIPLFTYSPETLINLEPETVKKMLGRMKDKAKFNKLVRFFSRNPLYYYIWCVEMEDGTFVFTHKAFYLYMDRKKEVQIYEDDTKSWKVATEDHCRALRKRYDEMYGEHEKDTFVVLTDNKNRITMKKFSTAINTYFEERKDFFIAMYVTISE